MISTRGLNENYESLDLVRPDPSDSDGNPICPWAKNNFRKFMDDAAEASGYFMRKTFEALQANFDDELVKAPLIEHRSNDQYLLIQDGVVIACTNEIDQDECEGATSKFLGPNPFQMNAGLNDAWFYPVTSGQGFFITVFPDIGYVSLAWFTYDTELPPLDATARLGDPGHRWLTAVGPIDGNQALMSIEMTSGGIFDAASVITRTDPPGSDGTILLTFDNCESGTVEYDIPSISMSGIVPIQRVVGDNIALCEALNTN